MTTRRGFLGSILAAGFAPAIGHAGILMPVKKIVPFVAPIQLSSDWTRYDVAQNADTTEVVVFVNGEVKYKFPSGDPHLRFTSDGRTILRLPQAIGKDQLFSIYAKRADKGMFVHGQTLTQGKPEVWRRS